MIHPTREEWMTYLYGELDRKSKTPLRAHLDSCAECRQKVAAWREAMTALNAWRLPEARSRPMWARPVLRWAVAAALLFLVAYGATRLASPDQDKLTRNLEASLRPSLEAEITRKLRRELDTAWEAKLAATRVQCRQDMMELAGQTFAASNAGTQKILAELVRCLDAQRSAELEATTALFTELESRRLTGDRLLQNDLLTLAGRVGEEFLRTREDVGRALTYSAAFYPVSAAPESPETPEKRREE